VPQIDSDLLASIAKSARHAGVFASVEVDGGRVVCRAEGSGEPAFYRVGEDGGAWWAELVMRDRWLSESIEATLMHAGDSIEELLDEELADVGYDGPTPKVEHFRSDDMLFTFRTRIPSADAVTAARFLLAYEQCFRNLGDMEAGDDEG